MAGSFPLRAQERMPAPGDRWESLTVGGRNRSYLLHLPPENPTRSPLPLIMLLHGGGGNASGIERIAGMNAAADRRGFAAAYPNGSGYLSSRLLTWNAGNCCGYALDRQIDDVAFIRTLIDRLVAQRIADPRRIYITGISNGGMMTYRLACELADRVTGIAPVAGALNIECRPVRPVAVVVFHGMADRNVRYEGGRPYQQYDRHPRVDRSVADAVAFWTGRNGCTAGRQGTQTGPVIREAYTGCRDGADVVLYAIQDGLHAWPGGQRGAFFLDQPTDAISATEVMLEFFASHARP